MVLDHAFPIGVDRPDTDSPDSSLALPASQVGGNGNFGKKHPEAETTSLAEADDFDCVPDESPGVGNHCFWPFSMPFGKGLHDSERFDLPDHR